MLDRVSDRNPACMVYVAKSELAEANEKQTENKEKMKNKKNF